MAIIIPFDMTNQFLISFLFVFAIVFGALQIANVFKNKAVHAIMGLAIALFATMYPPFLATLWSYLPNVTWFFIIMFFIAFVMEIMGFRKKKPQALEGLVIQTGVLLVLLSLGYVISRNYPVEIPIIGSTENLIFLVGFISIISIFMSVLKLDIGGPPKEGGKK